MQKSGQLGVLDDEIGFGLGSPRIHRHEYEPGQCDSELRYQPLRGVGRPDSNSLTGREMLHEVAGGTFRLGVELGVAPALRQPGFGQEHQRKLVGIGPRWWPAAVLRH